MNRSAAWMAIAAFMGASSFSPWLLGFSHASDWEIAQGAVGRSSQSEERFSLEGLEGYAAEELQRALAASRQRVRVVRSIDDSPDAAGRPGSLRRAVFSARAAEENEFTWIVFDPKAFPLGEDRAIELVEPLELSSNTAIDGRGARVALSSPRDIHLIKIRDEQDIILRNLAFRKIAPFAREKWRK